MRASSSPSSTPNFTLARDWGHLRRLVKSLSNEVTRLQSRLLETQKLLQQREETIKKLLEHRRKELWRWLWPRAARLQEMLGIGRGGGSTAREYGGRRKRLRSNYSLSNRNADRGTALSIIPNIN